MAGEIAHPGETAWIVGKGPSLLRLTADMIGPGPVITINEAIVHVRTLHLPNTIYVFQKDGCVAHGPGAYVPPGPGHACERFVVDLLPPEIALFSKAESPYCKDDYSPRIVVDVELLGIPWYTPSSPTATALFAKAGVTEIVYVSHDARFGDLHSVEHGVAVTEREDHGYISSWQTAERLATEAGVAFRYLTP